MNETSLEYVHRLINLIPQQNDHFMYDDKEYQLSILLLRLNEDFQSTYYGRGKSQSGIIDKDYIALHHQLKKLRISKRDMMSER